MRPNLNAFFLSSAIVLAYLFVKIPLLNGYAIQAVSVSTFVYFLIKRLTSQKMRNVLPNNGSLELVFVTFSLLLVIGKTGNIGSPFYPLTYVHLFFLVMSLEPFLAVFVMTGAMLFHFSLADTIDISTLAHLFTLPIVMIFFMFAKQQHEEVVLEKKQIEDEKNLINYQQSLQKQLEQKLSILTSSVQKTIMKLRFWQKQFFTCEPLINQEIEKTAQELEQKITFATQNDKNSDQQ